MMIGPWVNFTFGNYKMSTKNRFIKTNDKLGQELDKGSDTPRLHVPTHLSGKSPRYSKISCLRAACHLAGTNTAF